MSISIIPVAAELDIIPSANIHFRNDTEYSTTSATYVPLANISLSSLPVSISGTINISFDLKGNTAPGTFNGMVQKNGIDIGTVQTSTSSTYATKTQTNITTQLNNTDVFTLTGKRVLAGQTAYVRNFRISYDGYQNITSGNITISVLATNLSYSINRSGSLITENDANDSSSSFLSQRTGGTFEDSKAFDAIAGLSNTSNTITAKYNSSLGNETIIWTIIDNDTVYVNRTLSVTATTDIVEFEHRIPLLTDTKDDSVFPRYDFVWLNNSLAANDIKMWSPYITKDGAVSGINTRYARYDPGLGVIVSSRNKNQYFRINMSGTASLMANASARQAGVTNRTKQKHLVFHFGFINRTAWNYTDLVNPEASVAVSPGNTLHQNMSFEFHDNTGDFRDGQMLPDGNKIVNMTRFTDVGEFPNQTVVAKDARFMATALVGTRLYSLWYYNETNPDLPYIFDSSVPYSSFTSPSAARIIQGSYYLLNSSGKQVAQTWADGINNWNDQYKTYPVTKLEAENYSDFPSGWNVWPGPDDYSNGYMVYALTAPTGPLQLNFTGDSLTLLFTAGTDKGYANVSVDGGGNVTIDTYDASTCPVAIYQCPVIIVSNLDYNPGLNPSYNVHNVKVFWTGLKNASSTGYQVSVDAFEVTRNDTGDQMFAYLHREGTVLASDYQGPEVRVDRMVSSIAGSDSIYGDDGDYFNQSVNITINGTTYPYNLSLYTEGTPGRGATWFFIENPLIYYTIYATDGLTPWLESRISRLERHAEWDYGMHLDVDSGLPYQPFEFGEPAFHDNLMSSGYRGAEGAMMVFYMDILANLHNASGNTTLRDKWISRRDAMKANMVKPVGQGGLWVIESDCETEMGTMCGHFLDSQEPHYPVTVEVEERVFVNHNNWTMYEDYANVGGGYVSGRVWGGHQYDELRWPNQTIWRPQVRRLYYTNGSVPITYQFYGTGLDVVTWNNYNYGIINITIDGVPHQVDLYSASAKAGAIKTVNHSLGFGLHNVTFQKSGLKNASATDFNVNLDAVKVYNATIIGGQHYSFDPFTVNIFNTTMKDALKTWIYWHEGNGICDDGSTLKTDWLYPPVPSGLSPGVIKPYAAVISWGFHLEGGNDTSGDIGMERFQDPSICKFEDGGHFSMSAGKVAGLSGNYSDMQPWVETEKEKYGMREYYLANATVPVLSTLDEGEESEYTGSAIYEDQMAGGFLAAYTSIWSTGYEAASDTTPPATITELTNATGNFWINWTWNNPVDADFDHTEIYINGTLTTNTSSELYNATYSAHAERTIGTRTVDINGNVNTTWVNQTAQIANNVPTLSNATNQTVNEMNVVYIDIDCSDEDSDTCVFSNNRTDLFTDFSSSTGKGNWTTDYTDSGIYYIDIGVTDGFGGQTNYVMSITVLDIATGFVPPDPTNITNTTGNFWINHSWDAGVGNISNTYNVSVNEIWTNGSSNTYIYSTLSVHAWANTTVFAYNTSGTGTLSTGSTSQNTQIPNNAPTQSEIGTKTVTAGQWLNFTISSTDLDSDGLIYGTNATNGTLADNAFSWLTTAGDVGTYYWEFTTSDNYGGTDQETITIEVQQGGTVEGYIYSIGLTPVENVNVNVSLSNGSYLPTFSITNSEGYWNMTSLNGTYYVFASWENESSNKSSSFFVNGSQSTWVNLTLIDTYNLTTGQNVSINMSTSFDFDEDSINYSCNRTDLFTDFSSTLGTGNWTNVSEGTVNVKFGADDGVNFTNKTLRFIVSPEGFGEPNPPSITSWKNNITDNTTSNFTINTSTGVSFNATSNQSITTWLWAVNGSDQSNNNEYFNTSWSTGGLRNVSVNATNTNGTTQTIYWNVTVIVPLVTPDLPSVTSWSNNITNNATSSFTVNTSVGISFNATANQSGTWLWAVNGTDQSNDNPYFNTSWVTSGLRNVSVNLTNINGTTQTIYWDVLVSAIPVSANPPAITSYLNNITSNSTTEFYLNVNNPVLFSAGSNQTITTWTWTTATKIGGDGSTNTTASYLFTTAGDFSVTVQGTNTNGSTNIITWSIHVVADGGGGTDYDTAEGWIFTTEGSPINAATVTTAVGSTSTNINGYYSFGYLFIHGNTYWFNVTKNGYITNSTQVTFSTGDNTVWNATLSATGVVPTPTLVSVSVVPHKIFKCQGSNITATFANTTNITGVTLSLEMPTKGTDEMFTMINISNSTYTYIYGNDNTTINGNKSVNFDIVDLNGNLTLGSSEYVFVYSDDCTGSNIASASMTIGIGNYTNSLGAASSDFLAWFAAPYIAMWGNIFYIFMLFVFCGIVYMKTQKITAPLLLAFLGLAALGSVGLIPEEYKNIAMLLMGASIAAVFWKLFKS